MRRSLLALCTVLLFTSCKPGGQSSDEAKKKANSKDGVKTEAPGVDNSTDSTKGGNSGDLEGNQKNQDASIAEMKSLQEKIAILTMDLANNKQLTAEQRKLQEAELVGFKAQKEAADKKLKELNEKQAELEKKLKEGSSKGGTDPAKVGESGFAFCDKIYYGDLFSCGSKQCGKADKDYKDICEVTASSKPSTGAQPKNGSSGFPLCGDTYYGEAFTCTDQKCGKSDPAYQNICELTEKSKPSKGSGETGGLDPNIGKSGYPYCSVNTYGDTFKCGAYPCSKSDPEFKNICEIAPAIDPNDKPFEAGTEFYHIDEALKKIASLNSSVDVAPLVTKSADVKADYYALPYHNTEIEKANLNAKIAGLNASLATLGTKISAESMTYLTKAATALEAISKNLPTNQL
ncbi:MAG: hypothetical protein EOP04_21040 [Proteobacteria bacterium]|nr:MAG: hypothetical protein EOP04_21040 [Pseudomonadota bacterium]